MSEWAGGNSKCNASRPYLLKNHSVFDSYLKDHSVPQHLLAGQPELKHCTVMRPIPSPPPGQDVAFSPKSYIPAVLAP